MTVLAAENAVALAELAALARLAASLRSETRDHVARLGAVRAKLDAGEPRAAAELLGGPGDRPGEIASTVAGRIENRMLAGLLVGEADIARRKGVALELDPRSRFRRLPDGLDESRLISIVGNLLHNGFDAVAEAPPHRRRVSLLLSDARKRVRVRVRDWGSGLGGCSDAQLLTHGFTTKPGHSGVGLALVRDLAGDAGGTLRIERLRVGVAFDVGIPNG